MHRRLALVVTLVLVLAGSPAAAEPTPAAPILLREITLVPESPAPAVAKPLAQVETDTPQLWMLQLAAPVRDSQLAELRRIGLSIVSYIPENTYVVWGDSAARAALADLAADGRNVRWAGPYHPAYRLAPSLRAPALAAAGTALDVTVQLYTTADRERTLGRLRVLGTFYGQPYDLLGLTTVALRLPQSELSTVASWADVFNIEPYAPPQPQDERQGQIVAGHITLNSGKTAPAGPGYLDWLRSKGFPDDPAAYPQVDLVDDGLDQGLITDVLHPDFYQRGDKTQPSRIAAITNCTSDALGDSRMGHGNLNAGIMAGYNSRSGAPYTDTLGYRLGLGIAPFIRISATKIFRNSGSADTSGCGGGLAVNYPGIAARSLANGAAISSNSWAFPSSASYDAAAQAYDALIRDASATISGNQELLQVFVAGNYPSGIRSPGTAKNVLSVGATEGVRDNGIFDGCGHNAADSADDIAPFSSRGPTSDGRAKPDLVAPGTHIQGPASQAPGYSGTGTCNTAYYPLGQTLYTWSSGTSFAAPAAAGAAALAYEYYGRALMPGHKPSPAMLKALLLNSTRYLSGVGSGGTLPGAGQGWGGLNLAPLLDDTPRTLSDQQIMLSDPGQSFVVSGTVARADQPLRVSLVWTDAPGSTTTTKTLVSDLDLSLTIGGKTYRGNVFADNTSIAGGSPDRANNVEQIFLPAGTTGSFSITVTAVALPGDGVPGNSDPTDQDFALVVGNAATQLPDLRLNDVVWHEVAGNGNAAIDPGETIALQVGLTNSGTGAATGISTTLATTSPMVSLSATLAAYPTLTASTTLTNTTPYGLRVGLSHECGAQIPFTQTIRSDQGLFTTTFSLPVGQLVAGSYRCEPYLPMHLPEQTYLPFIGVCALRSCPNSQAERSAQPDRSADQGRRALADNRQRPATGAPPRHHGWPSSLLPAPRGSLRVAGSAPRFPA